EAALGLHAPEELEHHFRLLGVVALVVLPANLAVLADGRLDRRRSDVEAYDEIVEPVEPVQHEARCSAKLAAVPAATPACGTLYVPDRISGVVRDASAPAEIPMRSSTSSYSRCARFFASVRIIWQRDSACTSASPLISSGAYKRSGYLPTTAAIAPTLIVFGMHE